MNANSKITLGEDISDLISLTEMVDKFRETYSLSKEVCYNIHLVCEELFVNFITHSAATDYSKQFSIELALHDKDLTITVYDNGHPFNPLSADLPDLTADLDDRSFGGLGIYLVRHWADNVSYEYQDKMNRIVIKKLVK